MFALPKLRSLAAGRRIWGNFNGESGPLIGYPQVDRCGFAPRRQPGQSRKQQKTTKGCWLLFRLHLR